MSAIAYDDAGVTMAVEPSYSDELQEPNSNITADIDWILEEQRRLWLWAGQLPLTDINGFNCRCIILAWMFVRNLGLIPRKRSLIGSAKRNKALIAGLRASKMNSQCLSVACHTFENRINPYEPRNS